MKYLPSNTLAYFNAAPQVKQHDLSALPTSVFGVATKEYRKTCGEAFPNDEAVSFYALNHCAAIVRKLFTPHEPLPGWAQDVMRDYTTVCSSQGLRMLHYILSITTREMRHLLSSTPAAVYQHIAAQWGVEMSDFIKLLTQHNETGAVSKYMDSPPKVPIGHYVQAIAYAFHHGKWNSAYGGKNWGYVTDAAVAMILGKTSMEMLIDTGYTLAHNGGPIFNKGMMYSHQDNSSLLTILDVQRSGQMPELILDNANYGVKKTSVAIAGVQLVAANRPGEFKGWVDWYPVDAMRPAKDKAAVPQKYEKFKQAQQKSHPTTVAAKKAQEKVLHGKKVKVTGTWDVFPGQSVEVYERVSA